jgi:large subunit ribosomal protein L5
MAYVTLQNRLQTEIAKNVAKKLSIQNVNAVPRIEKVVVSVGLNKSKMDGKEMQAYVQNTLSIITGQKPVFTKAKKAISNFKTREGMVVGAMVTLRGEAMTEFMDRLLSYSLPRIRDFRGLPKKFDGQGNYSIGIKDHSIFPEVPPPDAKQIFGLQVQIKTTATSDADALVLLQELGVPFRRSAPVKTSGRKETQGTEKKDDSVEEEVKSNNNTDE